MAHSFHIRTKSFGTHLVEMFIVFKDKIKHTTNKMNILLSFVFEALASLFFKMRMETVNPLETNQIVIEKHFISIQYSSIVYIK